MTVLSAADRRRLKSSQFAGPNRSYPVPDRSHAANAKARAKQQYDEGRISKAQYEAIVAAANKVLGRGKTKGKSSLRKALEG
jgi:hypothetical protein